jgi:Cysteine-rich CPCC
MKQPCPCCGFLTFDGPPGSYDICSICFWEDDIVQLAFPDLAGAANKCSLIEGQQNFKSFGASERRLLSHIRKTEATDVRDLSWRPLDIASDCYLTWNNQPDHDLWKSVKDDGEICLYYWSENYWLKNRKTKPSV